MSLSRRKSKKDLLERAAEIERSQITEKQERFAPCAICANGPDTLYQKLKKSLEYIQEISQSNFEPAFVSDSNNICLELNQTQQETAMDSLGVGEQIVCCALEDIEIPYHLPSQNRLERLGMHLTKNPGFAYTD